MVILSSAICTKNGKALLARQFVEMSRIRIEGLLAAFPKLLGSGEEKQHTFIETDTVRYIYQPIEALFLLIITNKASNIVEDLETLRLLSKVVPDVAGGVSEEKVMDKCFELVFAFDEVISWGGYRESISLQQIKTNMEMDSHEEKLHLMIKQSKMDSAKDQAARQAKAIRERQREQQARERGMSGGGGPGNKPLGQYQGIGSSDSYVPSAAGSSYGGGFGSSSVPSAYGGSPPPDSIRNESATKAVSKGMKLGAPGKSSSLLDSLVQEDKLAALAMAAPSAPKPGTTAAPPPPVMPNHPVQLVVEERVTVHLKPDGAVDAFEVKGSLTLTATTDAAALCKVQLGLEDKLGFNFQTHPKINKQVYDQSKVLVLKDANKGFPAGRPVGVLRWSLSSSDESLVPLSINCWPEEEGRGKINVNIEYNLNGDKELHDVAVVIPLGTSEPPQVASIDGTFKHDAREQRMIWQLDLIDSSNSAGSLEFTISGRDPGAFFPISVSFASQSLYVDVAVQGVSGVESNAPIQYGLVKSLQPESYLIG